MVTSIDGEIFPNLAIHPGELLGEELEARGIELEAFAETIGCPLAHLKEVIGGRADFDAPLAVALERALKLSARFWMNRQTTYELIIAYHAAEEPRRVAI